MEPVKSNMVVMEGDVLSAFMLSPLSASGDGGDAVDVSSMLDPDEALERLKTDSVAARQLLACPGRILYNGPQRDRLDDVGRSYGVRIRTVRTGDGRQMPGYEGGNVYGEFLTDLRARYVAYLEAEGMSEVPVRPGQIVCDFMSSRELTSDISQYEERRVRYLRDGRYRMYPHQSRTRKEHVSDIEMTEREEDELFIHTEHYFMSRDAARRAYYASKDGTTGHDQREDSTGIAFQTFECPFGLDGRSTVRVGSAAEMSYMYERGLRGEVDWHGYVVSLRDRGLLRNIGDGDIHNLANRLRAQFEWMRERIFNDSYLAERFIVADLYLVPDSSMGRSIYDPVYAPSPAHVLARYINNPQLLSVSSENSVARALEMQDHNEILCFHEDMSPVDRTVRIIVDGSDTIGGRVPGTRAVNGTKTVYRKDEQGRIMKDKYNNPIVERVVKQPDIQFKPNEEIEEDYRRFSARLDVILQHLSSKTSVEFVTGTGIGTPQMVRRYVQEHGGEVNEWDYVRSRRVKVQDASQQDARYSVVRMSGFADVVPVLVGRSGSASILMTPGDESTERVITRGELVGGGLDVSGYVACSIAAASDCSRILHRASLAVTEGLPVIHVQENRSEEEQKYDLKVSSMDTFSALVGERMYEESLFVGERRMDWEVPSMTASNRSSFGSGEDGVVPMVAFFYDEAVPVNGYQFHSAYSVYAAMMMRTAGITDPVRYRSLSENEGSVEYVSDVLRNIKVTDHQREVCMRNAVHCLAVASPRFATALERTGYLPNVAVSTFGGTELFVGPDGHGANMFGIVMDAEREYIRQDRIARRHKAEMEAKAIAEENARLLRRAGTQRAVAEKVSSGLPSDRRESEGAVWFLGTNHPCELVDAEETQSVAIWEQTAGAADVLNRELASRSRLSDGNGGFVENNAVFLFPSDLAAQTGRRHVKNDPNERNLTGVTRINPATGEEFVCAYGISVKKNGEWDEQDNLLGNPCSFFTERDSSTLVNSIVSADALARTQAMRQNMVLSYAVYPDRKGNLDNDDISRIYNPKRYDYFVKKEVVLRDPDTGAVAVCYSGDLARMIRHAVRLSDDGVLRHGDVVFCLNKAGNICTDEQHRCPVSDLSVDSMDGLVPALKAFGIMKGSQFSPEYRRFVSPLPGVRLPVVSGKAVYNSRDREMQLPEGEMKKQWVDNPHASPLLKDIVKRYESVLEQSALMPLNCICLPEKDYGHVSDEAVRRLAGVPDGQPVTDEQRRQVTESKFLSDFNFTLQLVNAAAVASDMKMRFPIDKNGRLILGPGVPENLRVLAEHKLDAFLGESDGIRYADGRLPYIERTRQLMVGADVLADGHDINLRPNDLMTAFGPYDFSQVSNDWKGPVHEMSFVLEDGSLFKLHNTNLAKNMSVGEINSYLRYDRNPVSRFVVKTNAPERTPQFLAVLKEYVARAKDVGVETRTVTEHELRRLDDERRESLLRLVGQYDVGGSCESYVRDKVRSFVLGHEEGIPSPLLDRIRAAAGGLVAVDDGVSLRERVDAFCGSGAYHDVLVKDVKAMAEKACLSMVRDGTGGQSQAVVVKAVSEYLAHQPDSLRKLIDEFTDAFTYDYETGSFSRADIRRAVAEYVVEGQRVSSDSRLFYNVSQYAGEYAEGHGIVSVRMKALADYAGRHPECMEAMAGGFVDSFRRKCDVGSVTADDLHNAFVSYVTDGRCSLSDEELCRQVMHSVQEYVEKQAVVSVHRYVNEFTDAFLQSWPVEEHMPEVVCDMLAPYVESGSLDACDDVMRGRLKEFIDASLSEIVEEKVQTVSDGVLAGLGQRMPFLVECACADMDAGRPCDAVVASLDEAWRRYSAHNDVGSVLEYVAAAGDRAEAYLDVSYVWQEFVCNALADEWNRYCRRSNSQPEVEPVTGDMLYNPEEGFDREFINKVRNTLSDGDDVYGLDCFVNLLSSNSDEIAVDPHDVGARGEATALDLANRFDATDMESSYYGKEEAKDAFAGYVQFRYNLPDGTKSDWVTIADKRDRELAVDLIFSKINRVYRSDVRAVPAPAVLESEVRSLAIRHAGTAFRDIVMNRNDSEIKSTVRTVELNAGQQQKDGGSDKNAVDAGKDERPVVNVNYGKGQNAALSNFAVRPFKFPVEKMKRTKPIGV